MTSPAQKSRQEEQELSPDFCPSKSHLNVSKWQKPTHIQSCTCEGARIADFTVLASPVQEGTLEKGRIQAEWASAH